jgi:hypothetical protein
LILVFEEETLILQKIEKWNKLKRIEAFGGWYFLHPPQH